MKKEVIWIAGGTGLVGQQLLKELDNHKYDVYILTRKKLNSNQKANEIHWNTQNMTISTDILPDYIINLAGAGIADQRWTSSRKKELVDSRTLSAETILKYLMSKNHKLKSYLAASAVGYYGHRHNEVLTEISHPGTEFMSECCALWEEASMKLKNYSEKLCIFRIGIVLSSQDGALPKMLMTEGLRIFNYFGNGHQYYPWIHIKDLTGFIIFSLQNKHIDGIFNTVAPQQITNKEMMKNIIKSNNIKGLLFSAPAFVLKIVLGEMSAVVLNSNRIDTTKIENSGYKFQFVDVGLAVKNIKATKI